jgi:hypothetical protein
MAHALPDAWQTAAGGLVSAPVLPFVLVPAPEPGPLPLLVVEVVAEVLVEAFPTRKPATKRPAITTAAEKAITRVVERGRCWLEGSAIKAIRLFGSATR